MSINQEGLDTQVKSGSVSISVPQCHPLLWIASNLPWRHLADLALVDLKQTTKGFWWMGRSLCLRLHLAVFILQARFDLADRQVEESLRYNALFQIFTGRHFLKEWSPLEHTAICRFRGRLQPETQRQILIAVVKTAERLGFADPSWMDLDSTVQEGNMAYPSDANMMLKLARNAGRIIDWLRNKGTTTLPEELSIDLAGIAKTSKEYFFLAKNTVIEKRREVFRRLHRQVKKSVYPLIDFLQSSGQSSLALLPWNLREQARIVGEDAKRYLLDVAHFIREHALKPGKILSLHLREVTCICKGKLGKDREFGRVFQLGRIGGNFLIPMACTSVRMEDKLNFGGAIAEHAAIFGSGCLESIATDKGYFSKANFKIAAKAGMREIGLQCPGRVKIKQSSENIVDAKRLRDRRAGIEPLIGHAKRFGLGKSRMKSDVSTLASGYRSVLGFNLRQIERHFSGVMKKAA